MNMLKFLPPRLRIPVRMFVGGSVMTVVGVIISGWVAAAFLVPFVIIVTVWYYHLGGGDSDVAAVVLGQGDAPAGRAQVRPRPRSRGCVRVARPASTG